MAHGWQLSSLSVAMGQRRRCSADGRAAALSPQVYGWFTEGFGTRDLKEAKALLEELGA
jgi:predicted ATPase